MVTNYIGADVDCRMTELAVERGGKIVCRDRVPTDIASLRTFLDSVSGRKVVVIEEGPMSGWLYRNLRTCVERFVISDPRRNKAIYDDGDKADSLDAGALAALYRGGYIREVYHTDDEQRLALKEAVALYHDRVKEAVRQVNKLRGLCRSHGLGIPALALRDSGVRESWLADLKSPDLASQLRILWIGYDAVRRQVTLIQKDLARQARSYPIIKLWKELPGVGLIRAVSLLAYLDTPRRFKTAKKLWKYGGVGLKRTASGTDKKGHPKTGYLQLERRCNHVLKAAVMGMALSAIRQGKNGFYYYYERLVQHGLTDSNARHSVARKMLSVMWGMWKTHTRYEERRV